MLQKKNQENENNAIIELMQEQKKQLAEKINEYETSEGQEEKSSTKLEIRIQEMHSENQRL